MEIFSPLVGVTFRPAEAKEIVKALTPSDGHKLSLIADPTNEYDSHAVKVVDEETGTHLGFIAKENNLEIFEALQRGEELKVEIVGFENTIKPTLLITERGALDHEPEAEDQEPLD
jgi:hypothetical protein